MRLRPLISQLRAVVESTSPSGGVVSAGPTSVPVAVQMPQATPPSWPFRTAAAQRVWNTAQDLVFGFPDLGPQDVLQRAVQSAGVDGADLTPEDGQLVLMAIKWLQSSVPPPAPPAPVAVPAK